MYAEAESMRRYLIAGGIAATACLATSDAAASGEGFVTIGMSMAVKLCCSEGGAVGFGPAFNYSRYVRTSLPHEPAIGAFAWLHVYPALHSTRLGLGPQASYLIAGAELGPSLVFGEETHVTVSATPFVSVGFVWVGLRANFPAYEKDPLLEFVAGAGYPFGQLKCCGK